MVEDFVCTCLVNIKYNTCWFRWVFDVYGCIPCEFGQRHWCMWCDCGYSLSLSICFCLCDGCSVIYFWFLYNEYGWFMCGEEYDELVGTCLVIEPTHIV